MQTAGHRGSIPLRSAPDTTSLPSGEKSRLFTPPVSLLSIDTVLLGGEYMIRWQRCTPPVITAVPSLRGSRRQRVRSSSRCAVGFSKGLPQHSTVLQQVAQQGGHHFKAGHVARAGNPVKEGTEHRQHTHRALPAGVTYCPYRRCLCSLLSLHSCRPHTPCEPACPCTLT